MKCKYIFEFTISEGVTKEVEASSRNYWNAVYTAKQQIGSYIRFRHIGTEKC